MCCNFILIWFVTHRWHKTDVWKNRVMFSKREEKFSKHYIMTRDILFAAMETLPYKLQGSQGFSISKKSDFS